MKGLKKLRWLFALIGQIIICFAIGLGVALSLWISAKLNTILSYTVLPLFGAASCYFSTILGMNNFLAWLVPPATAFAAHIIVWGYAPDAGPILLCALISVIGAAAGEVVKRQNNAKK